jgi:tetratricopeptide (TPR) repeat protein
MKTIMWIAASAALLWAAPSIGADKLAFAPRPDWVGIEPLATDDARSDGSALRVLSIEQQMRLEPQAQTMFARSVIRIQTPDGLAAGTLSLSWRPETEELTIHKVQILRGRQVIDVLAGGQTFTILRRETGLEQAMLDGTLTASLQPEGLQVGDVIVLETSLRRSDPVFKGHVEEMSGAFATAPADRARLRIEWPATLDLHVAATEDIPALKPVRAGDRMTLAVAMDDVQPLIPPAGAPPRFMIGRIVEASDFASWADLAALMAPYFDTASAIPKTGPLRVELDRIASASADPRARAEAALALVQQRVRYVALTMGAGGYVPAAAELTWSRRFGDCKGKTVLLLGLLHALGIAADAVLVNTAAGDGIDQRLPAASVFNHVIVRATIADRIDVPDFGWGLPLTADAKLVAITPPPYATPQATTTIRIDASAGAYAPAAFHGETLLTGDGALGIKFAIANGTASQRDSSLRDYWRGEYDFVDIRSVGASYDEKTGTARLIADGIARIEWASRNYQPDNVGIGYRADFTRQPGRHDDAPFAVAYPASSKVEETLLLPPGNFTLGHGADIDQTVAGVAYHRRARITGQVFTVEQTERAMTPEFPARDAPAAQATLRALAGQFLYVLLPSDYRLTEADKQAILASMPSTASEFLRRAGVRLENRRVDDALADLDAAIAIEPGNIDALIRRAYLLIDREQTDEAAKSIAAATAVNPTARQLPYVTAALLAAQGKTNEAIAAFTAILGTNPADSWSRSRRAALYRQSGEKDLADQDAKLVIAANPTMIDMYLLRANMLLGRAPVDEIAAVAASLEKAVPAEAHAHLVAALIYQKIGRTAEADKAFERALSIKPQAYIYLARAAARPKANISARTADIERAIKLEPQSLGAKMAMGELLDETRDYARAIETWSAVLAMDPKTSSALIARGVDYARTGQQAFAEKDFAASRSADPSASNLNGLCWKKATANLMLASALADCDAALAKSPTSRAILDSRGFVLFRLGRFDDAIVAYDAALAKAPREPASLFGRGLAYAARGDKAKADADFTAAAAITSEIDEEFAGYGLRRTGPFPPPAQSAEKR